MSAASVLATFHLAALQVLKQRLSVHEPSIMCGEFMYEEGEGLEDDEVAENTAHLNKRLEALPGMGQGVSRATPGSFHSCGCSSLQGLQGGHISHARSCGVAVST